MKQTDVRSSALHLLHRASQRADELFISNTGRADLRPRQYAVLRVLAKNQDISQTDIVEATGIDRSTLADIVRRLVSKGLVRRNRTKSDARMYEVRLTPSGNNALSTAERAAKAAELKMFSKLSAGERNKLINTLAHVLETSEPVNGAAKTAPAPRKKAAKRRKSK
ncbi:MAG: MarR family winged helix-turn-helix transcriptional regulator [Hyphomicrobiaceae bacterium]